MEKMKKLLFLLVFIICSTATYASHIVGGEIYYKYKGNNRYDVKLILYRDCSNPFNLELDDSTDIIAYKTLTTNALDFRVYRQDIDTLPITIASQCSQLPDVCVERHVYTATITLPASTNGWTLFFSTCCRNATVGNIVSPDNAGATYLVTIPPTSQLTVNFGNPEFQSFPPIAICANKPVTFNNSVVSSSGDSVVYSLYTPIDEVDSNASHQFIFDPITWKLPYSQNNMLGGVPLTINPVTGFLSGTPNTLGQFLVGVQARVYRNGVLVSETRRDFQFNVADCFDNVGFTFTRSCGSKTVVFTNRTTAHNTFSWTFGDGGTSTSTNPTHTYAAFGTYTVTLHTDSIPGCPSTFTQVVTIGNDQPTANFNIPTIPNCLSPSDTIRIPDASTSTPGFPIVSWEWFVNGTSYSFDKNLLYYYDPNDVLFSTIVLQLEVKTATGCSDDIIKTLTIKGQTPVYTLTHDYNFCKTGQPQQFTVDLDYDFFDFLTFSWTPTAGVSTPTSSNPTITTNQSGTYFVTVSKNINNVTCTKLDSIHVNFVKPDIYVPKDTTAPCGTNFIKVTPKGDSTAYAIQWSTNPGFTNIISTKNSVVMNKPAGTTLTYYYRADFGSGCVYTDSVRVTFLTGAPAITLADNLSFCTRNITVPVTVNPPGTVQWSTDRNFGTILSSANPLVLPQGQNTVKYFVRSGTGNCVTKDSVTVNANDPLTTNVISDALICGNKTLLTANTTGITGPTIKWSFNSSLTPVISIKDTLTVNKPAGTTQKVYIQVTGSNGCSVTDSATITFSSAPTITLADNLSFCTRSITVPVTVSPSVSVEWSTDRNFTTIVSTANPLVLTQAQNVVKYFVRAGAANCTSKDSVTVTANNPLTGNLISDVFICGNKTVLSANTTGINGPTIKWSFNSSLTPVIGTTDTLTVNKPAGNTQKVYVQVTASNGCSLTDSATVTFNTIIPVITLVPDTTPCTNHVHLTALVVPTSTVVWAGSLSFTPVLSSTTTLDLTQIVKTKVYYIKATNNGCSVIDSVSVTIPDTFPQIQLNDQIYLCNDSVRLRPVLTNVDSVIWSLDKNFSTVFSTLPDLTLAQAQPVVTYYLKAFFQSCFTTDSVKVFFNNISPTIVLAGSLTICNDNVNVLALITNVDSARWYSDRNLTISLGTGATLQTTQPVHQQTYYIKANYIGCSTVDSITVTNNAFTYSKSNVGVCRGTTANINLDVQSPVNYTIDWKFNDSTFTTNTSAIQLTPDSTHILSFTIFNGSCRSIDSLVVSVFDNPVVDALADKDSLQAGEQVQLNTNPNTGLTFNWTPQGAVSNSTIANPTSSPTQTTTYVVHVSDGNNCTGSDSVTVRVVDLSCSRQDVYIPNAFTPNGDNVNDLFRARTSGMKSIRLIVYDRIGDKVFDTTDMNAGWDGNFKGQPAPMDSYGYYFSGECPLGEKIVVKGNVTLMR
jgi:gliding motility-associated-like protein